MPRVVHYLRDQGRGQVHPFAFHMFNTLRIPMVLIARSGFLSSVDQVSSWCSLSFFRGFQ
jgi:hypothetical protein